jgi:hypothetical protein
MANLPVSLTRLHLVSCSGVLAHSLAHLGRLTALKHLSLEALLNANIDEGMQQLAPRLHSRLSSLQFTGFRNLEVSAVP